jgi:16S rRNA (guanine(966)-N(2))-methyltransferase RsmD
MKKRHSDSREKTVFQIDNDNQGTFDAAMFHKKPAAEKDTKDPDTKPTGKKQKNVGSEPFQKDAVGLRVIGGKLRGSKLQYIGDNRVRPMKDRVREAVFNLIGPGVNGKYVIDLFGGTGALIIEAISRGAVGGTVIELHLPTAGKLRENLQSLQLTHVELKKTDAFFWAKNVAEHPKDTPPWLVFCSPPYDFYVSRETETIELIRQVYQSSPLGSMFIIESDERFDAALLPCDLEDARIRNYPPAKIAIFEKKS